MCRHKPFMWLGVLLRSWLGLDVQLLPLALTIKWQLSSGKKKKSPNLICSILFYLSCLRSMLWGKNRGKWKVGSCRESNAGHQAWAPSALSLNYDNWTNYQPLQSLVVPRFDSLWMLSFTFLYFHFTTSKNHYIISSVRQSVLSIVSLALFAQTAKMMESISEGLARFSFISTIHWLRLSKLALLVTS